MRVVVVTMVRVKLVLVMMKLEEVRRTYSVRYEEFILSVEKSAAEVKKEIEMVLVVFY